MDYLQSQVEILDKNPELLVGGVTSVNMTPLSGGLQTNVVLLMMTIVFDIQLAVNVDHAEFENMVIKYLTFNLNCVIYHSYSIQLIRWCNEAGGNVKIKILFELKGDKVESTMINDSNPF